MARSFSILIASRSSNTYWLFLIVCPVEVKTNKQNPLLPYNTKIMGNIKSILTGTSLVAQLLRIRLPVQGMWVQALVQEDPTCRGATKPVSHNY